MQLEKVIVNCEHPEYGDGYVVFEIKINSFENDSIVVASDYLGFSRTNFEFVSTNFKDKSCKMSTSPMYLSKVYKGVKAETLLLTITKFELQQNLSSNRNSAERIKSFLAHGSYHIEYNYNGRVLQVHKKAGDIVTCF